MYLSKLLIVNYRSCQWLEVDFLKDEPNIFIGVNDCGKTSILKALELLLADKPQIFVPRDGARKSDISNSRLGADALNEKFAQLSMPVPEYSGSEVIVIGKFCPEDEDFLDGDIQQLKAQSLWALENSSTSGLWYCRSFDQEGKIKNFLLMPEGSTEAGEDHSFFSLTAAQLSRKRTELGVTAEEIANGNGVGRFSNLEIIRALYSRVQIANKWVEWKYEKSLLPTFRYLDWNSSFDNILESAAEALKDLIEGHLTPVKERAREGALAAQAALNNRLMGHREVIASILPQVQELSANIHFEVKEKITDLLITKLGADGPVHMDLQGDGIKRQIWFALIKAAAIGSVEVTRKKHIWAFDEPETHLYPTAQRQLFEIIKEVSKASIQSLISTHSTVFIDKANLEAIKIVAQHNNYTVHSTCESIDEVFHSLEIRNSDFLFHNKFLVVEGDTEEYLIPALYKLHTGRTLQQDNIQLVVLRSASNWLTQKRVLEAVFEGFRKPIEEVTYLFDRDQQFELGSGARANNMYFVGRQDIEDSLPSAIWSTIASAVYPGAVILSTDAIEEIKQSIPENQRVDRHAKFVPQLNRTIRLLAEEQGIETFDSIPAKGKQLADMILLHLTERAQIPHEIVRCFGGLLPQLTVPETESEATEQASA